MRDEFKNAANVKYLTKDNISFYETEAGLIGARLDGRDEGRVNVLRLFPLHRKEQFLSVRKCGAGRRGADVEIGIIEDMSDFPEEQKKIINRELDKRYFVPVITKLINVKEEFGHTYWETETTAGARSFTTFDMSSCIIQTGESSLILVDVDGSRYEIKDLKALGDKAVKTLDIWL